METETETEAETEAEPPSNASSALTLFILVIYIQKNATKFETRITRHETIRHDSVCDVMRFRKFTDTFD